MVATQKEFKVVAVGERVPLWGGLRALPYVQYVRNSSVVKDQRIAYDGDYTKLDVTPALAKLVEWLNKSPDTLSWQFKGYKAYTCANQNCKVDVAFLPMLDVGTLHPYTSFKHTSRCLGKVLDQLEFLEKHTGVEYVYDIVLTCPGWVSESLLEPHTLTSVKSGKTLTEQNVGGYDVLKRFRRAVSLYFEFLSKELNKPDHPNLGCGDKFGGWYAVHVWSTNRPLERHLHAHCIIPAVVYNPKERKFYKANPYHKGEPKIPERVAKECWRNALKTVGFWGDGDANSLPDVSVKYVKIRVPSKDTVDNLKDRARAQSANSAEFELNFSKLYCKLPKSAFTELNGRLIHKIRYAFRFPLVDLNDNLKLSDLSGADRKWCEFLISYTTRRNKIGYLTNLKRFGFICRNSVSVRCPVCGSPMALVGKIYSNLPDIPHFIRDRGGGWSAIPPPFAKIECQTEFATADLEFKPKPKTVHTRGVWL